jgi:hypothetical protein
MATKTNGKTKTAPKTADVRGAAPRIAQIQAMESSVVSDRNLLTGMLKITAAHGLTSVAELRKHAPTRFTNDKSAGVFESSFNCGHKCAQVIGIDATAALVDSAGKLGGTAWTCALSALRSVIKAGKARAAAGKKGLATGKEAQALTKAALSAAGATLAKAPKKAAKKGAKTPTADTPAALVADFVALLIRAKKLTAPEGRAQAWANALDDARKASENFGIAVKK